MRSTYTYAVLEVSPDVYRQVAKLLRASGYHGAFQKDDGQEVIDMHGIALKSLHQVPASPNGGDESALSGNLGGGGWEGGSLDLENIWDGL